MSLRASWEKEFLWGLQQTSIATAVVFDATSQSIVVGLAKLKTTNNPSLNSGFQLVEQNKATGQSTRLLGTNASGEMQIGVSFPNTSIEIDANANNMGLALWLLFQNGAAEAVGTPFVKTFTRYTSAAVETWSSIAEVLSSATAAENRIIDGNIIRSITVAGDAGTQSIKVTAEFAGGTFTASYDASSIPASRDPDIAVLLYKNMTCEIDGLAVNLDSFTFTITNNATTKAYDAQSPQKHILNMLQVTGEIVLPKDTGQASLDDNAMLTKFTSLTDFILELYWGSSPAVADGDLAFSFNVVSTDNEEVDSDGEIANRIPFENADDGTNDISITLADDIDRAIP